LDTQLENLGFSRPARFSTSAFGPVSGFIFAHPRIAARNCAGGEPLRHASCADSRRYPGQPRLPILTGEIGICHPATIPRASSACVGTTTMVATTRPHRHRRAAKSGEFLVENQRRLKPHRRDIAMMKRISKGDAASAPGPRSGLIGARYFTQPTRCNHSVRRTANYSGAPPPRAPIGRVVSIRRRWPDRAADAPRRRSRWPRAAARPLRTAERLNRSGVAKKGLVKVLARVRWSDPTVLKRKAVQYLSPRGRGPQLQSAIARLRPS
jgi:hypothetical protein